MSQLDFFKKSRKPRVQMMSYRDLGWDARGRAAEFECEKCGLREWRNVENDAEAFAGVPCRRCAKNSALKRR